MAPPSRASKTRQNECHRGRGQGKDVASEGAGKASAETSDATWAASLDGDEQDEGAPFAVLEADGEGRGSRGLHALLRLLERKEPSFLLEEDVAASGGSGGGSVGEVASAGILDSELDSFLSMPAASDLSVVPHPPPLPNLSYMYVCMYVCIYVCMYVCMYVYVHIYISYPHVYTNVLCLSWLLFVPLFPSFVLCVPNMCVPKMCAVDHVYPVCTPVH